MDEQLWEKIACQTCGASGCKLELEMSMRDLIREDPANVDLSILGAELDTPLRYVRCRGCGMIYANPRLTREGNRRFYNEFKGHDEPAENPLAESRAAREGTVRYTRKMLRTLPDMRLALALAGQKLFALKQDDPSLTLLDYGCGRGFLMRLGRMLGIECEGVELSQSRIAECRALGFRAGTREEILGKQYDLVISQSVLEHTSDLNQYLEDIATSVRPGGVMICNGLSTATIEIEKKRGRFKLVHPISHLSMFNRTSLRSLLERHGFHVPGRLELARLLRAGHWSWYEILPFLIYGAIRVYGPSIHAVALRPRGGHEG